MAAVLVVEDDEDLSLLLSMIVGDKGHEVRVAAHGLEALERVAEKMPDLILLDIKMPVMDGREFAAQFRRRYGHAARLVVMTASESAAKRAQEIDADGWLAKPFEPEELTKVLALCSSAPTQPPAAAG